MSAITAKASRKMKKYAVLTREPRCFLGSFDFSWEQRKFGEIASKYEDPVPTPHDGYYRLGIRSHAKGTFHSYVAKGQELETAQMHRVAAGNFIVNITFGWEHAVAITDENDAGKLVSHRFPQFSFAEGMVPEFFRYVIVDEKFRHHLWLASPGGAGRNRVLKLDDMLNYLMRFPSRDEQIKIAEFFRQLDHLITLHQRKCALLFSPFQAFISMMFTTSTFSWEQRKLEDYLTVSAEKNTGNIYGRSDVLSVSGDYGIVNQIEFQGRSFAGASVSNYGVVQTGDVVYTKSPLNSNPYGIIKTNKGKPGIVSTLYAVYHPKENAFSDFIQVYFEQHARMNNYMHPLVNKGAKNDMKVSAENALKGPVCFPSRIEQESISAFFSVLDNLITLHQRKPFLMKWRTSDANRNQTNRLVL